jgi:polar amino acid transport system substrate-binding protein
LRRFRPDIPLRPIWALTIASVLSSACVADAQPEGELLWAADAEGGAPFVFKDPQNLRRDIGFEVELAAALSRQLRRPIKFKPYEYKRLTDGLERGDFDFAMNGLEVTEDRQKTLLLTRPYYAFRLQLAVRADEIRFDSLHGCKRHNGRVGTLEDTAASRLLDRWGIRSRLYDGQVEPYHDLDFGEIDAVLLDLPIAVYYARRSLVTPDPPRVKLVGNILGRGYYAIAVNKKNPALHQELDAALARLIASGELRRILENWGLWNDQQEELLLDVTRAARRPAWAALGATVSPASAAASLLADQYALPPAGEFSETDAGEEQAPEPGGYLGLLLEGAWETIKITLLSFALAVAIGLVIALLRMYGPAWLRWIAVVYVEFFRGIPVLLLLAFLYFGLPAIARSFGWEAYGISLKMNPELAAILGLGLNYAAYESEIYRAGIAAIPIGQWEAAQSLGMSSTLTFRRIILPQALRIVLPPMTNDLVALFKDTSVVSVVAVTELTKQYLVLTKSSAEHLAEIALATSALYLVMSLPLGFLSRYLERRWGGK